MTRNQECRSCESEHPPDELSPSGLCIHCLPCTGPASPALAASRPTTTHHHPTITTQQDGPGRQAIREALAGFRQGKTIDRNSNG